MSLLDLVATPSQRVAYLFPEVVRRGQLRRTQLETDRTNGGAISVNGTLQDVFVFQFWPQQLQDNYQPNYATKQLPGSSHPLYQYAGGNGRLLSFEAQFVAEIEEEVTTVPFNQRIAAQTLGPAAQVGLGLAAGLLPSSRYTVDVTAAISSLSRYMYATYNDVNGKKGITEPPQRLILVLPNTNLGRRRGADGILCILLRADVVRESWFPSGKVRAATVSLQFAEVIQYSAGEGSNIKYVGADEYDDVASNYLVSGNQFNNATV